MDEPAQHLDWVRRAQKGEYEAFERLVAAFQGQVYNLALRIVRRPEDAEEVVQESLLSVIDHLEDLRDPARFRPWLMGIATNHALMLLRRRKKHAGQTIDSVSDDDPITHPDFIASWTEAPDRLAEQAETKQILAAALEGLDEKYRAVFVLRDVEGLSTEQTARALDISVSNAKVRLLRARLALREHLTRHFGDENARVIPARGHGGQAG